MSHVHRFELTVYYADTDAGGVVYHARYLEFFERARFELFQELVPGAVIPSVERGGYAVAGVHVTYKKPGRLGDRLVVETSVQEIKRASLVLNQRAVSTRSGELLCEADVSIVRVNHLWRPEPLPKELKEGLTLQWSSKEHRSRTEPPPHGSRP